MTISEETPDNNFEVSTTISCCDGDYIDNLSRLELTTQSVNSFIVFFENLETNHQVCHSMPIAIKKSSRSLPLSCSGASVSGQALLSSSQRLSTDSSSVGGYSWSYDDKLSFDNYTLKQKQPIKRRLSNTVSCDSAQLDSDSTSDALAAPTVLQTAQHRLFVKVENDSKEVDSEKVLEMKKNAISPKKKLLNIHNYKQREQPLYSSFCSKKWSLDPRRLSSGSTSSTESGVFSGTRSEHNYQPSSPKRNFEWRRVQKKSNDRWYRTNYPLNTANGSFYGKTPPGRPMPTSRTHFASSKSFNALPASALPQPPHHWLLNTREQLSLRHVEGEDEKELARKANTFDYYNLKMLLTVGA